LTNDVKEVNIYRYFGGLFGKNFEADPYI